MARLSGVRFGISRGSDPPPFDHPNAYGESLQGKIPNTHHTLVSGKRADGSERICFS